MDKIDRFRKIIYWGFRGLLIATAIVALCLGHFKELIFLGFTLFLTFLPHIVEEKIHLDYPSELEILILLFIIGSIYLGELHGYYTKYVWWDVVLHSMSAMIIAGIGFTIVFILNKSKRIAFKLSPGFVCLFAFCFAVSIGAIWEIFEFSMDQLFGLNMQRSGLMDTMSDLIVDCLGALIFSVVGYFHIKGEIGMFQRLERKFFKLNPELKKLFLGDGDEQTI